MRLAPTFAEKALWKLLHRLEQHFRRQAPMGRYVVDFVCHQERLVIELDGKVHALPQVAARDAERDAWLRSRGYRVLRLSNDLVTDDPVTALERITTQLSAGAPTPTPPREGEGL